MKKLLFIFNPTSGRARIKNRLYEIVDFYTNKGYTVTLYPTKGAEDRDSLFQQMETLYDLIVCSGGDGTLSNIISGILNSGKTYLLGYVPSGSTNDFGRSVGIPAKITDAMEITVSGSPCNIDIGRLNDRYFIYVAGFGAFTNVSYATSQKIKNTVGYMAYILGGIKAVSELKAYDLKMTYDGGCEEGKFIVGLVTNSYSVAGFKNPAHSLVKLDDGLFEALFIRMPQNISDLQAIISSLLSENVNSSDYILFLQVRWIYIESEAVKWTLDGEYGGEYDSVMIRNLHGGMKLMMPPH